MSRNGYIRYEGYDYVDGAGTRASIAVANHIKDSLPPAVEGNTRLWRANRPGEVGQNPSYTDSLLGIALPFMRAYRGFLSYVDVPTSKLGNYLCTAIAAADSEFMLTPELAKTAKVAAKKVGDLFVVDTEAKDEPPSQPEGKTCQRPTDNRPHGWDYLEL